MESSLTSRKSAPTGMRRIDWLPYLYFLPALLFMALILFFPIMLSLYMSVHASNLLRPTEVADFVGLGNYAAMVQSAQFWMNLRVTALFTLYSTIGALVLGLGCALLLNRNFRGRGIARALIIVPWAVPPIVVTIIWTLLFNPNFGVIDYIFTTLRLMDKPWIWLTEPTHAFIAVTVVTIWQHFPIATVMFLAGLQGIAPELHEAAAIDGAGIWSRFRHVTWPGLAPVTSVLVLLLTIWIFRSFVTIFLMTNGGPGDATNTIVINVYLQAFQFFNFGYATALGSVTLLISLAFSVVYLLFLKQFQFAEV